jgi:hypothetical protein
MYKELCSKGAISSEDVEPRLMMQPMMKVHRSGQMLSDPLIAPVNATLMDRNWKAAASLPRDGPLFIWQCPQRAQMAASMGFPPQAVENCPKLLDPFLRKFYHWP